MIDTEDPLFQPYSLGPLAMPADASSRSCGIWTV